MKAEDLMVGDIVALFGDKYAKVDCIGNVEVYLTDYVNECNWQTTYEHIKPIPLTPEILEKNGFEKHDFKFIWTLRTKEYKVQIEWKGKTMLEIGHNLTIKDEQGRCDNATYIRGWQENIYVHELQHALRLCRIEKEIVV